MKIYVFLLLLFAVIRTTSSQCTPGTVRMQRTDQSGDEGDSISVNFVLDCVLVDTDFTVGLTYSNKDTTNDDYNTALTTVDIPAGTMFFGASMSLTGDMTVEDDEAFCVVLNSVGSGGSGTDSLSISGVASELLTTVTILNDDTATVSITAGSPSHTEGDTDTTATVTLMWSKQLQDTGFTQVLSYIDGTAIAASDYTTISTTVTLPAGSPTSIEVPITITGDTLIENDESFTVSLGLASTPGSYVDTNAIITHATSVSSVITIVDDDTLNVNFVSCGSQNEGTDNVEFIVSYTPSVITTGYSFSFSIDSGTTTAESGDYTPYGALSSSPINIPTSQTIQTFSLTYVEDMKVEDDEEIVFVLTSVDGPGATAVGPTATITCTIVDDDTAMLSIEGANSVAENIGTLTTMLSLTNQLEDTGYSATITLVDGTADSSDYSTFSTVVGIPTCTSSFEYLLSITDDDTVEDCESFTISLMSVSTPTGFRIDGLSIDTTMDVSTATISVDETATVGIVDILTYTEGSGTSFSVLLSSTVPAGAYQDSGYSATITILPGSTEGVGMDYSSNMESVLLPTNGGDATISIALVDNLKFEDFETFTASLIGVSAPTGFKADIITVDTTQDMKNGVIADDDSVSLSFQSSSVTVAEASTTTITVCLDKQFEDGIFTLNLAYIGDLASSGSFIDYSPQLTVDIPADTSKVSFSVTVSGDTWVEDTETVDIALSSVTFPTGYTRTGGTSFVNPSTFSFTVTDDDFATISLVSSSMTVTEQDSTDVTVTVSFAIDNTILISGYSVSVDWIDDTASVADNDYTGGAPSVSIPVQATMQTFEFPVLSNLIVEDHESLTVSLNSIITPPSLIRVDAAVVISTPSGDSSVITIEDDDTATLCFQDLPSVTESLSYTYTFTTDLQIEDQFSVSVGFGPGSAKSYSNGDETVQVPLTSNGETFLSLTLVDDNMVEDFDTFSVTLGPVFDPNGYNRNPGEAVVIGSGTCSQVDTIIFDDDTVTLAMDISNSQLQEGNTEYLNVDIDGGELCIESVSLMIAYTDGTTTSSDYSGTTTVIVIPTSASQLGFQIPTHEDDIVEDNESFQVILMGVSAGGSTMRTDVGIITTNAADQTTTVTIMDDDSATLTVSSANECFNEDDTTNVITLTLDKQLQDTGFTFDLVYTDITALAGSDYSNTDIQGDIPMLTTTLTYSITLTDDVIVEADQSFSLSLTAVNHPTGYVRSDAIFLHTTERTSTVTIKEDDTATLSVSTSKITVLESDQSAEVVFCLSNTIEDQSGFSVAISFAAKTAHDQTSANVDYTSSAAMLQLPQDPTDKLTATVAINDDNLAEDLESFCVSMSSVTAPFADHVVIGTGQETTTVCITDDNTATVSISPSSLSHTEGDTDTTTTVTLQWSAPLQDAGFTQVLSYIDGTAASPSDYTPVSTTVTLPAEPVMSIEVPITIVGDTVIEDDEIFTVSLGLASVPAGYVNINAITTDATSATTEITIVNDDTLTVNFVSCDSQNEGTNNVEFVVSYSPVLTTTGFSFSYTLDTVATSAEPGDYTPYGDLSSSPINIPTGQAMQTFSMTYVEDMKVEDEEEIVFVLTSVDGAGATLVGPQATVTCTITDNDNAMISIQGSNSIAEDAGTLTTMLSLTNQLEDTGYSATITLVDGTADSSDYSTFSTVFGIPTCTSSFEYLLSITDDDTVENCESFTISLMSISTPTGFRIDGLSIDTTMDVSTATISVDETATVGIEDIMTYTEGGAASLTVVLTSTVPVGGFQETGYSATISILQGSTEGTGAGGDYISDMETVALPLAGGGTTISIGLMNNDKYEDFETYTASLIGVSPPTGFKTEIIEIDIAQNMKTGVIADDDSVSLSFQSSSVTVGEASTTTATICLDNPFEDGTFTLNLDYSGDLESTGSFIDYSAALTVDIPADTTKVSFTVTVSGDSWVEDTETIDIALSSITPPTGFSRTDGRAIVSPSTFSMTVTDDDSATISLVSSAITVTEQDVTDVTVTLTFDIDNTILISGYSVSIDWIDDTAFVANNDYTSGALSVSIPVQATMQTFEFVVDSNTIVEDDESLTVSLNSIVPPGLIRADQAVYIATSPGDSSVITIVDDDTATLCFEDLPSVTEGSNYFYTFTTDLEIEDQFTVSVQFVSGSATKSYSNVGGTKLVPLNSNSNMFSTSLSLTLVDDNNVEDFDTFSVSLDTIAGPVAYNRNWADAVVFGTGTCTQVVTTIHDDDTAIISMNVPTSQVSEGDIETVTIDLGGAQLCIESVSLTVTYIDRTTTPSDYTATTTIIAIPTSVSMLELQIPTDEDQIVEDHKSFDVILMDVNADGSTMRSNVALITATTADQTTTVTILDDDSATLTATSATECFNENDPTTVITLLLDKQFQDPGFTFDLVYADITAFSGSDYSNLDTQGDIPTLTTLLTYSITLIDDSIVEADQSFSVSLNSVNHPIGYVRSDAIYLHPTDRTSTITIKEDDTATLSVSTSKITVLESDSSAEVVLCLSNTIEDQTGFSVDISYDTKSAHDQTSTNVDYTAGPPMFLLPEDPVNKLTATVAINNDNVVEDLESFCLSMSSVTGPLTDHVMIATGQETTTVCITDDDTATLALQVQSSVTEDATTVTASFILTGNSIEDAGFTATLGFSGDAADPSDYASIGTVPITPSTATTTFELVIQEDSVVEDHEQIIMELLSVQHPFIDRTAGAVIIHPTSTSATQTLTIMDEDTATISFQSLTYAANEGDGTIEIILDLTNTVQDPGYSFSILLAPLTAEENDYNTLTTSFGIDAMSLSTTITIGISPDNILEDNESFEISLVSTTNPVGYDAGRGQGIVLGSMSTTTTATINDDDSASCVFDPSTYCPSEADSTLSITFTCDIVIEDSGYSATLTYIDGDASVVNDYSILSSSVGLLTAGSALSFAVSIVDDMIVEDDQSFTIGVSDISEPVGFIRSGIIASDSSVTVTVKDDDTATCFVNNDPTVTESIDNFVTIEVVCDKQVEESGFSIDLFVMDVTTEGANDYDVTVSSIDIPSLTETFSASLSITNNQDVEDNESFTVTLGNVNLPAGFTRPSAVTTADVTGTVVINDDDTATCTLSLVSDCVTENTDVSICIICDKMFEDSGYEVSLAYTPDTAAYDSDYTSTVTMATYPSSTTTLKIALDIVDDMIVEDDQSFSIEFAGGNEPSGFLRNDAIEIVTSTSTVLIKDDDTLSCSLSTPVTTVTEGVGVTADVEAMCNYEVEATGFSLDITYLPKTATEGNDYTASPTAVAVPVATTLFSFTIQIINDEVVEDCSSFCLELNDVSQPSTFIRSNSAFAVSSTSTVSILDDDTATCSLSLVSDCVTENTDVSICILCDKMFEDNGFEVSLAYTPDTAVYDNDYTGTVTMATYPSLTTTLKIALDIVDDMIVEDDQSFSIEFTGGNEPSGFCRNNAIEIVASTSTATIKDDDTLSCSLSTGVTTVTEGVGVTADIEVSCNLDVEAVGFSLDITYLAKSATEGNDYTASPTAVAVPVATTLFSFTVPIINDEVVEYCSSFCVELNDVSQPSTFIRTNSASAVSSTSTVSILDDDTATCSFVTSEICVDEDIGTYCAEVTCDNEIEDPGVNFLVSYMAGTAVEPDDYTTFDSLFEFATLTTSLSFCGLSIEDDAIIEIDEYLIINVLDVQFPGGCMDTNSVDFQGSQTVTIKSDDQERMTTRQIETTQASTPGPDRTTDSGLEDTTVAGPTPDRTTAEGTTAEGTTAEGTTDEPSTEGVSVPNGEIGVRKFDDEDPCAVSNPCSGPNMVCFSSNGVANCTCASGYDMQGEDYEECRDKNECIESPCTANQDCINLDGSYECICHDGYQMIGEGYCEDINECATGQHNCMMFEATVCENTLGNFTCSCIDGHVKSSSGNCIPTHVCDPMERRKCQFPEDLCFVDEFKESFCSCSPGFARSTVSLPCENKNECLEIPDVCKAITNSRCVDDVPTLSSPNGFYHCECEPGYVEIATGRCLKELVFRVGMVVVAVNGDEGFSLWSEDLVNKESQKFQKTSRLLCSFLEDAVLSHPEVNMTRCLGLGFSPEGSDLKAAISLTVVSTKETVTADAVRTTLVTSSQYSDTNILVWQKENRESLSVQDSSFDVKVLDDITCSVSFCKNGGICAVDTTLYQTVCRCRGNYTGPYCEINEGKEQDTSVLKDDTTNLKVGLFIGLAFASLVFFLVVVGICLLLLKSQRTGKIVSRGDSEFKMTKKHPLLTHVPNIVRNPGVEEPVSNRNSHKSEEVDYDEIRLRRLQQGFMRMGGSSPMNHTNKDEFEDKDGDGVSSLFTIPYETDGSINV